MNSDRIDKDRRLHIVRERALHVLRSSKAVEHFLSTPNFPLGGDRPIDMLVTELGMHHVLDELNAMEHGLPV